MHNFFFNKKLGVVNVNNLYHFEITDFVRNFISKGNRSVDNINQIHYSCVVYTTLQTRVNGVSIQHTYGLWCTIVSYACFVSFPIHSVCKVLICSIKILQVSIQSARNTGQHNENKLPVVLRKFLLSSLFIFFSVLSRLCLILIQ